jgi:ABC-type bacteriocin/lantibiotic exporter with double-glycine peptidase domain
MTTSKFEGPSALPSFPLKQNDFSKSKIQTTWWACTYCCIALILDFVFKTKLTNLDIIELLSFHTSKLNHVSSGVDPDIIKDALVDYGICPLRIESICFNYNNYARSDVEEILENNISIFLQENHAVVIVSISERYYLMDPDDHKNQYREIQLDEFVYESIRSDGTVSFIVILP